MNRKFQNILKRAAIYILAIIVVLPIIWLFISSFRPSGDIEKTPFELPTRLTTQNYSQLASLPGFYKSLKNSLIVALMTTFIVSLISIPISYILSRYSFKGKKVLKTFSLFGAYLFAPAILAFPYFKILSFLGLINSIFAIIITHICFCLPFSFSLGDLIFRSIPRQIEEVAIIGGVSVLKRIKAIVLPAVKPQLFALFVIIFAISWKEFFYAFILSTDNNSFTLPVLLSNQYGGESLNWNILCAISIVMMTPSFLVLIFGANLKMLNILTAGTKG